jgi:hypothetical protein
MEYNKYMSEYTQISKSIQELVNTPIQEIVDETIAWDDWKEDLEWFYDFRKTSSLPKELDPDIPAEVIEWAKTYIDEFYFDEWDDRREWDNDKNSRWLVFFRINDYLNLISISTMV